MPDFIPGLELSRLFFEEAVKPVLDADYPALSYDAAIIGSGSEVLGFDTPMSRDHHWGPRVTLFVNDVDQARYSESIVETFRHKLPYGFRGYPTSFEPIPGEAGTLRFEEKVSGPINHRISVTTVRQMLLDELDFDWIRPIEPADWLTFTEQKLRTLTHGAVYHTGLGEIPAMRTQLAYYPHDVWLYVLAAGWQRIGQEEPFVGRTGDVGDDIGSRLIAARLVRDLMRLCFLMERQYAPYPKWFGTAFARLTCAPTLTPIFERALSADNWQEREGHLAQAYSIAAGMHNGLAITDPLPTEVSLFHSRPYHVIHGEAFAAALLAEIGDEAVKQIAAKTLIGASDQFSDSTDLLSNPRLRQPLSALYW
jgi:hypothetical protein